MSSIRDDYVLIVDDDIDIGETLAIILQTRGYHSVVAHDGAEALQCLEADPLPRVVLLDLMMPGMNGQEFRAEQLKDPRIASIPVIVMSGDTHADEKAEAIKVQRYLRKPVTIDELMTAVRNPG